MEILGCHASGLKSVPVTSLAVNLALQGKISSVMDSWLKSKQFDEVKESYCVILNQM